MKTTTRIIGTGIMAAIVITLTGCSTAGPFVTNISSDGKGDIIVEKNTVKINGFTGMVSVGDNPQQEIVRIVPGPQSQK